jgi:hypothetical protein
MSIKRRLSSFSSNTKRYAKRTIAKVGRNERNVDIYLRSILQDGKVLQNLNDAASYVELSRACIEPTALRVTTLKSGNAGIDWENFWAGDVGLHFGVSSSLGHKGRLLANVIRLCRSERCLELGTAYGNVGHVRARDAVLSRLDHSFDDGGRLRAAIYTCASAAEGNAPGALSLVISGGRKTCCPS